MGIDVGSTASKCVIMKDGQEIVAKSLVPVGTGTSGPARAIAEVLDNAKMTREQMDFVLATGYGRNSLDGLADLQMSELSCHAKGATYLFPDVHTVVDIGGQDAKALRISPEGKLISFQMNDKCAAGTGRFFEVLTHRLLGIKMEELSDLMKKSKNACTISSMCTIFAESEIISYLSQKIPIEDIAAGTGRSIARRILAMGRSAQIQYLEPIVFSGGVANNEAITDIFAELLGKPVTAVKMPQSTAALGAALRAHKEYDKLQSA